MLPVPADAGNARHPPSLRTAPQAPTPPLGGRPQAPTGNHPSRRQRGPAHGSHSNLPPSSPAAPAPTTTRHKPPDRYRDKSRDRTPAPPDAMRERSSPGSRRRRPAYPRSSLFRPVLPDSFASAPPFPARRRTSSVVEPARDDGSPATHRPAIPTPRRSHQSDRPVSGRPIARPDRPPHRRE